MYNKKEINSKAIAKPTPIKKPNPYKDDVIVDPKGQWKYPGQVTKIPSGNITMKGVPYDVLGVDNLGNHKMMHPGMDYTFPGQEVTEYPQMKKGGTKFKKSHAPFDFEERARINEITMQSGGWLDQYDDELKMGGVKGVSRKTLTKGHRDKTSKNMQSSINFLQLRNKMLFGPSGRNIYDPKSKFEGGGWLDKYK